MLDGLVRIPTPGEGAELPVVGQAVAPRKTPSALSPSRASSTKTVATSLSVSELEKAAVSACSRSVRVRASSSSSYRRLRSSACPPWRVIAWIIDALSSSITTGRRR